MEINWAKEEAHVQDTLRRENWAKLPRFTCTFCEQVFVGQQPFEDHLLKMGREGDRNHG